MKKYVKYILLLIVILGVGFYYQSNQQKKDE